MINDPDERDRAVPPTDFQDSETAEELLAPGLHDAVHQVQEQADGSAVVNFDDENDDAQDDQDFMSNLAITLPESTLTSLANRMLQAFEVDKESRKQRDEQYAEGIKRTGIGNEAPGGADFEGASRAVHPVLIEGCIEFSARAMKELFPASGPVKTAIIGPVNDEKLQKAERKKSYMNWQLTSQIREYRSELEQTLTQVPLGGSQFLKVWYDDRVERPRVEFVAVDEMLLPFAASDFETAERKTHMQKLTGAVLRGRMRSGLYREASVGSGSVSPDSTEASKASDKVEGKSEPIMDEDETHLVYESYCELELEEDTFSKGERRSYILTIENDSRKVLALYRNWEEDSKKKSPPGLEWMVEFGFVPWRGAYKIGLAHIIGGLSGALTGALRAILDSAHLQNAPGGVILKGARVSGQNITTDPTEFTVLEGPPTVDDIRKLAMPYPISGPSNILFQMLDWLTTQAKGVVSTASEAIKDAGSDMPVGTALALIEQGAITFSAVHARLHASQRRVLEILHRINRDNLEDENTIEELGSLVVYRKDFDGPMDVMPVSDPNIFSDAQRYAQNQAALAMAEKFPGAFKLDKLVSRAMRLINYPDYGEVLNIPADAKRLPEDAENTAASDPDAQLKSYSDQDHLHHLQMHVHFMVSPIFCANPLMAMPALPKLLAHCKEHLLMFYTQNVRAASQAAQAVGLAKGGEVTVQGAAMADGEMAQQLQELMPLLQQAQQLADQFAPKPPMDPRAAATVQVAESKLKYQADKDQQDREASVQAAQAETQKEAVKAQSAQALQAQAQAAETARSTQEMQVAAHNAALAEQSESESRRIDLILEHMKQDAETNRAAQSEANKLLIAQISAKAQEDADQRQRDFEALQAHTQRQFDLLQALLTQKNSSASDAADKQIARAEKKE